MANTQLPGGGGGGGSGGGSGDGGDNGGGILDFVKSWDDLSLPGWLSNLKAFAHHPRRTVIGIFVSTIVGYAIWFGEVSIAGILAAAGFKVGIPDAPQGLPGLSDGKWIVPPQDYTGPVDLPGMIYNILASAVAPVGQAILDAFVAVNTRIATIATGSGGVPDLIAPLLVLFLWTLEFGVVIWMGKQLLGLAKQLTIDTINPL